MRFDEITAPKPTAESLAAEASHVAQLLDGGPRDKAVAEWDTARRSTDTWSALVHLRFAQDTKDAEAKAAREYADALAPVATEHEVAIKKRLIDDPDRAGVEALVTPHVLKLWQTDITTFDPAIASDLEEESRLTARYTELLASANFEIDGATVNLSGLTPYAESADREMRHRAESLRWSFFETNGAELDSIYDALVKLRHGMARKLGDETFTPLAYRRMRRTDYDAADVARYRDQVAEHVVPLIARLLESRRATFGWDKLRYWDEALIDPAGNPRPIGDHDTLVAAAQTMFDRMDPRLADFYRMMAAGGFLDLKNRPGKAGGGFCTSFPNAGVPFIFANFNGTHHDIGVFTHEMGHAFQCWESRNLPGIDQLWPTMEACEIHSMSLEFLTHPQMGLLVGDAAADRFQHEVFANPDATPEERHAIWKRLEQRYMPWSDYGDIGYLAKGGRWQAKHHIYNSPFYYIDYTLALCCALQFWVKSLHDPKAALDAYVALCERARRKRRHQPRRFHQLLERRRAAALAEVVREAEAVLGA
jgi:oligoendopeptidase F